MIRVELKKDTTAIGARVTGQAVWNSSGGKQPRKIEVQWRWRLEGKKRAEELVDTATDDHIEGRSQVVVPFDFKVPFEGPITYEGKLFRIIWEIVATVDLPWATDETDTKAVTVKPAVWTVEEYQKRCESEFDEEEGDDEDEPLEK